MKRKYSLTLLAAAGIAAATATTVAIAQDRAPAAAQGQPYWSGVDWDDDDDDRRRLGAMPVPNAEALKRAGMVRVAEVDRDDGEIEVEGRDAQGREIEVRMDASGRRVLAVLRDDDRDD